MTVAVVGPVSSTLTFLLSNSLLETFAAFFDRVPSIFLLPLISNAGQSGNHEWSVFITGNFAIISRHAVEVGR